MCYTLLNIDKILSIKTKQAEEKKLETVSSAEFIRMLIKHIPGEQFKQIRHYGIYSRRIKTLSKKLMGTWQKTVRRWLVAAKWLVRRKWSQKIKEQTGKTL